MDDIYKPKKNKYSEKKDPLKYLIITTCYDQSYIIASLVSFNSGLAIRNENRNERATNKPTYTHNRLRIYEY